MLPGFDEFLLGYADRSHVLAPEHVDAVCPGGNGIFRGTVVTAGQVVGTWVRERETIRATPFTAFSPAVTTGVLRRARTLPNGFLDEVTSPQPPGARAPRTAQAATPPTGGNGAPPLQKAETGPITVKRERPASTKGSSPWPASAVPP